MLFGLHCRRCIFQKWSLWGSREFRSNFIISTLYWLLNFRWWKSGVCLRNGGENSCIIEDFNLLEITQGFLPISFLNLISASSVSSFPKLSRTLCLKTVNFCTSLVNSWILFSALESWDSSWETRKTWSFSSPSRRTVSDSNWIISVSFVWTFLLNLFEYQLLVLKTPLEAD